MKKLLNILLIFSILLTNFFPVYLIKADECVYQLKIVKSAGADEIKSCYDSYSQAKTAMLAHNSDENNVAVITSNNQIINAKYAIVKFEPGNVIPLYPTASSSKSYTSIHTSYGIDAAFIDYDPTNKRVQVRISGYTGWTPIGSIGKTIRVNEKYGRSKVRSKPSVNSTSLGILEGGATATYSSIKDDLDGNPYKWYEINYNGGVGYVADATNDNEEWITILSTMLEIIPISDITKNSIKANSSMNMYSTTNTSSSIVAKINDGDVLPYATKTQVGGYTWYQASYNGKTGWLRASGNSITEVKYGLQTLYQSWTTGNLLHYFEHQISGFVTTGMNNLAKYPSFMSGTNVYYSFDGIYFYNSLKSMLDDYRSNNFNNAINKNKPHYSYYLYLPTHSKTGYTANDFNQYIKDRGYTKNKDNNVEYFKFNENTGKLDPVPGVSRSGISLLYGEGQSFVDAANTYGINSLMMFSTAINESGTGTSAIAFYKNNLFGLGAYDSNPVVGARRYDTVRDSVFDFAKFTGSDESNYTHPNRVYYFGSHYGNKGSGMNVYYATDPYWGEKQATNSFINDNGFGSQDYLANTIGVTNKTNVNLYKEPNGNEVIYVLKNNSKDLSVENIPLIVSDKVIGSDGKYWYKVYTDCALDVNQNIANTYYNFEYSYGYIKESDIYVSNSQPVINASNISIKQFETVDLLKNVTASDAEDGNLTSKIIVSGHYDKNVIGDYNITYTVEDSNRFSVSKTIVLKVLPADKPHINATDKEISQFTIFNALTGVTATDYIDGDITNNIEVIFNNVDTNIIGEYTVTYKVVNSNNKETTLDIVVRVVANKAPIIRATNQTISLNGTFNPLTGVTATDYEDGDITNKIKVIYNNVNPSVPGQYKVTYEVTDSAENVTTLDIYVTVEEINYTKVRGEFYFEKMDFNTNTNKLDVAGYLAITGMNNTRDTNIKYDLIFKNNYNNVEIIKPLERWLDGAPSRSYSDGKYNYSATWFKGSIDISDLSSGEYTLYIRARSGTSESLNLFRNIFEKNMAKKVETSNGKGFIFRNNNYLKDYPIELVVSDKGLITSVLPPNSSNMINNYRTISFNNKYLNIVGSSYNIGANYGSSTNVKRELIFENISTGNRYTYDIGSYVGEDIPLRVSDGFSKVRSWFDSTGKIDISQIEKGKYIIYIRTKTDKVDDHGELNDIFLKEINATTNINNKKYKITLNKDFRFRLELTVE